jgi:hypothetical protein
MSIPALTWKTGHYIHLPADIEMKKGDPNWRSPFLPSATSALFRLKIEAQRPLDLSFAEDRVTSGRIRTK